MTHSTDKFMDNIIARLSNGPMLNENELLKIIGDVESKMAETKEKIEHFERDIEEEAESLTHSDRCEADPLALHCFLNNVLQAAERNVGHEDHILSELISFCYRNCVALPPISCDGLISDSRFSLNTCEDEAEELTRNLWQKLHTKLKNGIFKLMRSIPITNEDKGVESAKFQQDQRIRLVELLCCLYPFKDVWHMYCCMRESQLDHFKPVESRIHGDNVKFTIQDLQDFIDTHEAMLNEDIELLLCINREDKDVTCLNELVNIFSNSVTYFSDYFVHNYQTVDDDIDMPVLRNASLLFDKLVQNFSVSRFRTLVKFFFLLDKWSSCLNTLRIECFHSICDNTASTLLSSEENLQEYHGLDELWNWHTVVESYIHVLREDIPIYIQCIFEALTMKNTVNNNVGGLQENLFVSGKLLSYDGTYPMKVTRQCGSVMTLISEIIFFMKYDESERLKTISEAATSSLIDRLNEYIEEGKKAVCAGPDTEIDINYLYNVACDSTFLESQISLWDIYCGGEEKSHGKFHLVSRCLKNAFNDYVKLIVKFHLDVLKSSLVYDMHGNNWEEDKYFYEGERCSFTIQMWNFYIRGVVHDVFSQLPMKLAKLIIKEICIEMMIFFTARYTFIKVACRRVKQFKADILALLHSFKWLLLFLVETPAEYLDLSGTSYELWHNLCCSLLLTVSVICSPLTAVIEYMNDSSESDHEKTEQLPIVWFNLIESEQYTWDNPTLLAFEILIKQPVGNLDLLVNFLAANNAEVPVLVVKNIAYFVEPVYKPDTNKNCKWNDMFMESINIESRAVTKETFLQNIYYILLNTSPQESFLKFMSTLMEGDTSKSFKVTCTDQIPLWLELVTRDVCITLKRIFYPALDLLMHGEKLKASPKFSFTNVHKLPCGCSTLPETDEKKFASESLLLFNALIITLDMLVDNISCIPRVIWDVFAYLKLECNVTASWTKQSQLGTKILACLLFNWLMTKENTFNLSYYCDISEEMNRKIKDFAELLWHVVYNLTYDVTDNPCISMEIYKDMLKSSDIIMMKLSALNSHCNISECNNDASYPTKNILLQKKFVPNLYLQSEEGVKSLNIVYDVLKFNENIIRELLTREGNVLSDDSKQTHQNSKCIFDPFVEFNQLGHDSLNHRELLEMEFDWCEMIQRIPLSKVKAYIVNRFEFQEESASILHEDEIADVAKIRSFLDDYPE